VREQQNYTAGIYCRLSSEDAANQESMSISNQREMLCDYVKRQGWEIGGVYVDEGAFG
jgi:DNA invertase Pin-like site-specific DNA recombinase